MLRAQFVLLRQRLFVLPLQVQLLSPGCDLLQVNPRISSARTHTRTHTSFYHAPCTIALSRSCSSTTLSSPTILPNICFHFCRSQQKFQLPLSPLHYQIWSSPLLPPLLLLFSYSSSYSSFSFGSPLVKLFWA